MLDNFDRFNSFHDWIFAGIGSDNRSNAVYLDLVSDNFEEHKTIIFMDVTRCLVTGYGLENIVYSLDIFSDGSSKKFIAAREILDQSTPFGSGLLPKKIAVLTASFGGEAWIEYSGYRILSKDPAKALPR